MRIVLSITMVLGVSLALAQKPDSVRVGKDPDSLSMTQPAVLGRHSPKMKPGVPFSEENAVKLQREEIPLFLQNTLRSEQFRGWENGAVYRNIETNEYRVDVVDGMRKETFFFDKNGTLLKSN
jgi:hypothetical protein